MRKKESKKEHKLTAREERIIDMTTVTCIELNKQGKNKLAQEVFLKSVCALLS